MVIYSGKRKLDYIFLGISDAYNLIKIRYLFVVSFFAYTFTFVYRQGKKIKQTSNYNFNYI